MQHKESVRVKVYQSSDYNQFKFITGNRSLNDSKIKKIINEIDNGNDMLCYYPIQVKETENGLDILDGQHRFFISKFFQRPVFYILIKESKEMHEIARVNSNVEKWKMDDFLNCYIKACDKNYLQVQEFMQKYPLNYSVVIKLLELGHPGGEGARSNATEDFKNGTFKVNEWDAAVELVEKCKLFEASGLWTSKGFIIAIYRIQKAGLISIEDLAAAYRMRPEMLTRQAAYKQYVNNLEQIVNVGKHKRIVIL